ncbi:hypothetical protein F5B19DRAFT_475617 [Rostrohypoxylon terebratum]|nr:hypothetical protein F5B19DRAFT_475617 [Rostrohypoxylon terebratum]
MVSFSYLVRADGCARKQIIEAPIDRRLSGEGGYHCTGSCKFCLTDWDASVEWIDPAHGWMVTIKTYHDFGNCRSPSYWKWKAMVEYIQDTKNRDKPSGAVKSGWHEGKGFCDEPILRLSKYSFIRGS